MKQADKQNLLAAVHSHTEVAALGWPQHCQQAVTEVQVGF